ncbi:acyltransferase family protein [Mesoplasma florum]|uniref:acyltransferase family protein n=1 Tax=Mesoplasma florum TaxID=2151 RepID=UPI000BE2A5F8|nr:acyltransferase family protein [Mesoplasma florum]ATI74099.1 hypothetical protein CQZ70_02470 [Mesoplasma florum]
MKLSKNNFNVKNLIIKKESSKRNSNIELLRFMLCIFVVLIHVGGIFWYATPLMFCSVPTFAIITGFFLYKKEDNYVGFKFIPTIVFFIILNILITFIINLTTNSLSNINWLNYITFGTSQFWYVWAMFYTLLLSPLLILGIKCLPKYLSLFLVFVFYMTFVFPKFQNIFGWNLWLYTLVGADWTCNVFIIISAVMLGAWINKYLYVSLLLNKKFVFKACLIFLSILLTLEIVSYALIRNAVILKETNLTLYSILYFISMLSTENNAPLTIIVSFCIFSMFCILEIKPNSVINFLGKMSMIIFVSHFTIIQWVDANLIGKFGVDMISPKRDLINLGITLAISFAVSFAFVPIYGFYIKIINNIIVKIKIKLITKN